MSAGHARLEALLAQFSRRVRLQIESNRLVQHGIDADDIEQEVRIRLWKTLERDPNAELPASYIQRVVVSTIVDALRRAQVRPAESLSDGEDAVADLAVAGQGPQHRAIDAQNVQLVADCIARLPVRRRVPLQLYLQGFSLNEVAELSDLTLDSARKLIYRGLHEIKQRLAALGLDPFEER